MLSAVMKTWVVVTLLCLTAVGVLYTSRWNLPSLYLRRSLELKSCDCQKCLNESDQGFKDLLDAAPKPFLSKRGPIFEEDFNWWKRLQREKRPFSFFNETVNKLFTIFPPVPDVEASSPDRCRTCAVVGNSGNLKGSHYGPLIDYHHIVIRMNGGRTKGYEEDVGTKTTHHVMYPESAKYLDNATHLVFFPFKINDLLWLLKTFTPREDGKENPQKRGNKDLVMILNPAFMKYVHEMWLKKSGSYPSTGFMTLVLSMQMCDEVSVFGFGADRDGNWSHYFEVLKNKRLRTGPHPGTQEYDVIQQLQRKQTIRLLKGF
ncbi:CMP-N-acetylneuraminate-beta-galactosamide-alpha-2,3-sialyltransferase 1-like isoform X1 [Entelurus aequoreus]|uniref:CMP-N-acetylneuraminate-beta-galactosamide- alpha-2,3-sialyltransferase 1-like isoform X1 n=1 Tax=Entelurus aequoreus TaxID=161455 RepID=UPI002B1E6BD0|nr:CMP-N-acetylneuraminate-beta-galactosamide-alpha-2,3-sialyltransferase 1-like isoform X1 [Entelurus aequoreus]XP_061885355.1 CMP-N-acetylneuraminate-beta-galactosamide-alpha-2,3-sialyltransferase 1-like isoform X1 [Entelurus aequoreus]